MYIKASTAISPLILRYQFKVENMYTYIHLKPCAECVRTNVLYMFLLLK